MVNSSKRNTETVMKIQFYPEAVVPWETWGNIKTKYVVLDNLFKLFSLSFFICTTES